MDKQRHILLAEDDPTDLEFILEAFKRCQMRNRVDFVRDGEAVLDYLNCRGTFTSRTPKNPAVIFIDLKMPKLNGYEVIEILKKDASFSRIPVVVFTSSKMDQDIIQCYGDGANSYIIKPVSFHQFIETVQEMSFYWTELNESVTQ